MLLWGQTQTLGTNSECADTKTDTKTKTDTDTNTMIGNIAIGQTINHIFEPVEQTVSVPAS